MNQRMIFLSFIICPLLWAQNPYRTLNSFNSGELSPLLNAREDLAKYQNGCSIMENLIPLPQGGAQKRPGTKYIAEVKTSSLATRVLPFEFSTSQSYIIEAGNQYMRFFTSGAAVLDGVGTENISGLDNVVGHWLLNEVEGTNVDDDNAATTSFDGTISVDASTLHVTGKVGTGCFDLDGQYNVTFVDRNGFSFTDNTDDEPFSMVCWAYVTQQSSNQVLMSKWDETTGAVAMEYRLSLNNEQKLQLHLADTSADLATDMIAQWYLNDVAGDTHCDEVTTNHDGVIADGEFASTLTATGKTAMTPCYDFDGQYAVEVNDDVALSFGNGTTDEPFSIVAWIYVVSSVTQQSIFTKYDLGVAKEYRLQIHSDGKLQFVLYDDSANAYVFKKTSSVLSDGWHFVVATYDGDETNPTNGMNLYVDGSIADSDADSGGTYIAMENTVTKVVIGATYSSSTLTSFCNDKIDNVILFDAEITSAKVSELYNEGAGIELLTSGSGQISAVTDDAISIGWHFFASTYSAPDNGSATAANGIILYVDGVAVDSTKTNNADYKAMQDGAGINRIGAQESIGGAAENFWADKIDELSIFKDVLTPTEVASLYSTTPYEIETPYLTADLFNLKYEQSADVLYIVHPDYESRKLSRLANALWELSVLGVTTGPFRTENADVADFITASGTTGSVTLTATGHNPFKLGQFSTHEPTGSNLTSKSQTGALFKLVHPLDTLEYTLLFTDSYDDVTTEGVSWLDCGTLYEGAGWTLVTDGTWSGTLEIQRNYTIGAAHGASGWETVLSYTSPLAANQRNALTSGTEDDGDADYRAILVSATTDDCLAIFTTDQTEHIGIVKITSVVSSTEAIGTVVTTLASTDATHRWSESSWSGYRGWPQTVTFFEDRLAFGGNTAQPDTLWLSVSSDYENMTAGPDDDEALIFTLSSRQVNVIEWIIGKDKLLIGTSGAEWTIAGGTDEPLTPSNAIAKQHSTYGSANLQAGIANESILFFQRGAEKMRELAYNWEIDSYVAPDMTILANLVTNGGIVDTAFQKTPNSILWCVRADGEIPVFSYERKENITAWSRMITQTNLAGTLTDSDFESVARISGNPEDEVWVIVNRTIEGDPVRYIEQFQPRDFGTDADDAFYVDSGVTYDSIASSAMTGLTHLNGQTVYVLADGVIFDTEVVTGGAITLSLNNVTTTAFTVQMGLGYEVHMRTMPLSWVAGDVTIQGRQKRISEVIANWYVSGDFSVGRDVSTLGTVSISGQTTSQNRITFPPGYDRNGYVYVYQKSPEPLTVLALIVEFDVN